MYVGLVTSIIEAQRGTYAMEELVGSDFPISRCGTVFGCMGGGVVMFSRTAPNCSHRRVADATRNSASANHVETKLTRKLVNLLI